MSKIEINYDAIKNAKGFEYSDNKEGVSCRLVPIEEAREQDKKVKAFEIIKKKGIDILEFRITRKAKTYNEHTKRVYVKEYTDEEYNLLKEALYDIRYNKKSI